LDLERVLSLMRLRGVLDQRIIQQLSDPFRIQCHNAERCLHEVDPWKGETGEGNIVRRAQHHDPAESIQARQKPISRGGNRPRIHIAGVRDDEDTRSNVRIDR
jgi:hypothetical protein